MSNPHQTDEVGQANAAESPQGKRPDETPHSEKNAEHGFRALMDALPDAVLVHRNGKIAYANHAAASMHGFSSAAELVGTNSFDLVHPDERDSSIQRVRDVQERRASAPFRERRLLRRDGSVFLAEVAGVEVTWEGNSAIAAIATDVSEKRQLLAELAQRDRLASMGLLAASVAHEVNNPITYVLLNLERLRADLPSIGGALSRLKDDLESELGVEKTNRLFARSGVQKALLTIDMLAQRADTATDGARQVGRIARDLTAFARVENDERAGVDVNSLLEKVLDLAANELRFRATVEKDLGPIQAITANQGRLSQVFLNLLVNAAHAIDEGAPERNRVHIRTWQSGAEVFVSISDTGHGIAPENLPRLFDPFFTTKQKGQGSGLGLSICRDILGSHGGSIDVKSQLGKGSEFILRLPIGNSDDRPTPNPVSSRSHTYEEKKARVLVVDDEETLRATLQVLLEEHFDVTLVESGKHAFEVLQSDRTFDAILCDLMMPEVSGMAVHAWVAHNAPELLDAMVFMTGGAFTKHAAEFLESVPNKHIEKPFDVTDLRNVLQSVARRRRKKAKS
ncbi:MAG: PAS domain S-box protein [Polyangiaceae bacterium]|nr:PAS domain S-box protein [Polyangiaceae bacterium]